MIDGKRAKYEKKRVNTYAYYLIHITFLPFHAWTTLQWLLCSYLTFHAIISATVQIIHTSFGDITKLFDRTVVVILTHFTVPTLQRYYCISEKNIRK